MAEPFDNAQPGVLITLEGVDGSGKTTQAELLEAALRERGRTCLRLREPGGSSISEQVRAILLDPANEGMAIEAELLLYEAARAQLVREVIEPALAEGTVVICDRFYDSSFAYQAAGRGLDEGLVQRANELGSCGLRPSRTVVLDIDPREAYVRAVERGADRMESEGLHFQERVRAGYLRVSELEPHRVRLVDGRGDVKTVFGRLVRSLADIVPELSGLDTDLFLSVIDDVERAFAEVEAAAALSAERAAQEAAELEAFEAEAARREAEEAARVMAAAAEAAAAADERAQAEAAEVARQAEAEELARAAEQEAEAARLAAEAEAEAEATAARQAAEAAARAQAEEAARRVAEENARIQAEAAARAEAQARARAAEEAELFAQVEAAVAAEARRMSLLDPKTFAREAQEAESDAMASLDVLPPFGIRNV